MVWRVQGCPLVDRCSVVTLCCVRRSVHADGAARGGASGSGPAVRELEPTAAPVPGVPARKRGHVRGVRQQRGASCLRADPGRRQGPEQRRLLRLSELLLTVIF